jgi:hypothetical protein
MRYPLILIVAVAVAGTVQAIEFKKHVNSDGSITYSNIPKSCTKNGLLVCGQYHPIFSKELDSVVKIKKPTKKLNASKKQITSLSSFQIGRLESSSKWTMPDSILLSVKTIAIKDHPNDYLTQNFVIRQQKKSYAEMAAYKNKKVPDNVLSKIVENSISDHPIDFPTQMFVVKEQVKAYLNRE